MKKLILAVGVVSVGLTGQLLAEQKSVIGQMADVISTGMGVATEIMSIPWLGAVSPETGPSSIVAFDAETRALLRNASAERGEAIAKKSKCAKCHSDNGVAEDQEDPTVAGQMASYSYKQLMDYKNGHRSDRSMKKAVKKLDAQMMADLAVWYESLPTPEPAHKGNNYGDVGFDLVYKGDPKRMIKPCGTCHGRNGEGGMHDSAKLVGQSRDYFIAAMEAFKEEDRTNDIYSRMRLIAMEMTDEEIEAVADYYAATPPADE